MGRYSINACGLGKEGKKKSYLPGPHLPLNHETFLEFKTVLFRLCHKPVQKYVIYLEKSLLKKYSMHIVASGVKFMPQN